MVQKKKKPIKPKLAREMWDIKPMTRVKESDKKYNRSRDKQQWKKGEYDEKD